MNRLHGHTHHPRVVATREHHSGGGDVDYVHTVAADHPTALASVLVGLVVETAEGPVYANQDGKIHGPYADATEALTQLTALHGTTPPPPESGEEETDMTNEEHEDWRTYANCRTEDPELFFPVGTTGPAVEQTNRAKKVCARCPVRDECLSWALDTGQSHGVWGGMSADERRGMHFRRQKHPRPLRYTRDGTLARPGRTDLVMLRDLADTGLGVREIEARTGYERNIVGAALSAAS